MLSLQDVTYKHPNQDVLFSNLHFNLKIHDKVALVGHNGSGKSTLLQLLAGHVEPKNGVLQNDQLTYLVPQVFGQFKNLTVGQALKIDQRLKALHAILDGQANEENFHLLQDDWTIEERCKEAFNYWDLTDVELSQSLDALSGGQKTKVFLAGIMIHQADLILMDEPSNHLDTASRKLLYHFIQYTNKTLLVVSHDRHLLNLLQLTYELQNGSIKIYGGNYDFYNQQKQLENEALIQELKNKEKDLRKAKEVARETIEREQKLDARGKKKQEKAGLPTISMNTLKNKAEKSTSKVMNAHTEKVDGINKALNTLRMKAVPAGKMKIGFDDTVLHAGKSLFQAERINFSYGDEMLWPGYLSFNLQSGDRMVIKGANGTGKSTLLKIITGQLQATTGECKSQIRQALYIDQDYSLINNQLSVYEQAQQYNDGWLQEHDVKMRLNRFLFDKESWDKPCSVLSGGERMRLMLCSLSIRQVKPDLLIFDEPTNNLDIQNVETLTQAINEYKGALIVVSHDGYFLQQIGIQKEVYLK